MRLKTNLIDWLVYMVLSFLLLIPFFPTSLDKHICGSLLVGFLFGMLNRIIRELDALKQKK